MTLQEFLKQIELQEGDIQQYLLVTEEYNPAWEKWVTLDIDEVQINHTTKQIFLK